MSDSQVFAVIVAGGKGRRMGKPEKKQYLHIDGVPILSRTLRLFDQCDLVNASVLVIPEKDETFCRTQIIGSHDFTKPIFIAYGGNQRQDSVFRGLETVKKKAVSFDDTIVLIHDGVRPFVPRELIADCIQGAIRHGACVPGKKITDTIKRVGTQNQILKTIDRNNLYSIQTPQAFRSGVLWEAFAYADENNLSGTDDAALVEYLGRTVKIVQGVKANIKITTPEDLAFAEFLISQN